MILGIDLGTTNSSCACYEADELLIIPNERGGRTSPSIVSLGEEGDILVGESAKNQALIRPEHTIRHAKRLLGTSVRIPFGKSEIDPEEALSYILNKLKHDAEHYMNCDIQDAVITVPAYFSELQRRAVKEAGKRAGLQVRRLLNEPTAAALAWAWSHKKKLDSSENTEQTVLVYDLGGGTFDVTVLKMNGTECRVLSTSGDNALGGADFDQLLLEKALAALEHEAPSAAIKSNPSVIQQLYDLIEHAKIELSTRESVTLMLPFAANGQHPSIKITRAMFESLITPLIDRSMLLTEQSLAEAGLLAEDVDLLVLSGGSSRIPLIRAKLKDRFGTYPEGRIHPEEIVCSGAALYAALMSGKLTGMHIHDAVSRSFGVEIDGDESVILIPKNTVLPAVKNRIFTTVSDNQETVEIHVIQGEFHKASENVSLGRFILGGIRKGKRGEPRIELEFSIDRDEILHVSARDIDTGAEQTVTIASAAEKSIIPQQLHSLVQHVLSLMPYADNDPALEVETQELVHAAKTLLADSAGGVFDAEDSSEAEKLSLGLRSLIAELEARSKKRNA